MRVLGILGSPRPGGNSDLLLEQALEGARDAGAETEKIELCRKNISGCFNCEKCNQTGECVIKDDMLEIHEKILSVDAIIHSGPVYFWAMTSQMKAYLDRWCAFFDRSWNWHQVYKTRMEGKRIGLITVCGDPDASTADPIVNSFKTLSEFGNMRWLGAVQASAGSKGEISTDEDIKRDAYELGKRSVRS